MVSLLEFHDVVIRLSMVSLLNCVHDVVFRVSIVSLLECPRCRY